MRIATETRAGCQPSSGLVKKAPRRPEPYAPTILIVDDDQETRMVFRRILEETGYFVSEAENGRQALAALEDSFFEIMILDLSMPDTDGIEVLQAVHSRFRHLRTIVVSEFVLGGTLLKTARLLGAVTAFDKMLANDLLLVSVCNALRC
jgi:CheY-like chemotaxis protein